jgi:hypothetical protein
MFRSKHRSLALTPGFEIKTNNDSNIPNKYPTDSKLLEDAVEDLVSYEKNLISQSDEELQ